MERGQGKPRPYVMSGLWSRHGVVWQCKPAATCGGVNPPLRHGHRYSLYGRVGIRRGLRQGSGVVMHQEPPALAALEDVGGLDQR